MSCTRVFKGIDLGCDVAVGGIKSVYIANRSDVTAITGVDAEGTTGVTYTGTQEMSNISEIGVGTTKPFKPYKFRKQTGSLTKTINISDTDGTTYWQNELSVQFTKMETKKRLEICALCASGDMMIIPVDNNGNAWLLGADRPVSVTAGSGESGTAMGDFNGYKLTFTDLSNYAPMPIDASALAAIVTDVVSE